MKGASKIRESSEKKLPACAVILAGGRGTRFWPRSRTRMPKQLLNIIGSQAMLQQTAARLAPIFRPAQIWVVTNNEQAGQVRKQLSSMPRAQILAEPLGRNTAAAIGLAAIHLRHRHGDALMAVLPSDQYIAQPERYRAIVRNALRVSTTPGHIGVLGIPPTRPDTGFGYIERRKPERGKSAHGSSVFAVRRFTEKPQPARAKKYLASRRYDWNAGMFFWRVSTYLEYLRAHLPKTHAALEELAGTIGTSAYARALRRIYPRLENISVDYAILEPATRQAGAPRVFVLPAKVGWSDIGSWEAVYELLAGAAHKDYSAKGAVNVAAGAHVTLDAHGNFLWSPKKFIAAVGVNDLVVVETPDALLICPRDRAQDVGKVVKWLEAGKHSELL
jgi:mannose-1-phosphate guanylyltransferase